MHQVPITILLSRYKDPFEEYKTRLAKTLAKRVEAEEKTETEMLKKKGDDINWFGVKVGTNSPAFSSGSTSGGIGKYLKDSGCVKRPLDQTQTPQAYAHDDAKKKRKIGFSDFDAW